MNALRELCWSTLLTLMLASTTCNQVEKQSSTDSPAPTQQIVIATPSPTPPFSATPFQDISIGRWKIAPHKYKAVSHKIRYAITGEYPLVRSADSRAVRLNRAIQNKISKQHAYATHPNCKDFYERGAFSKDDPLETSDFNYEILFGNDEFLSIRFHDMTYSAGAAHPLEDYFSLNFDLHRGAIFPLSSIFKSNTGYQQRLVELCKKGLDNQGVSTFPDAISAELRRHTEWNITREGLVINFDRCAVSGCMDGEHSVIIPYHELAKILSLRLNRILSK
jgi:hypothetical protein